MILGDFKMGVQIFYRAGSGQRSGSAGSDGSGPRFAIGSEAVTTGMGGKRAFTSSVVARSLPFKPAAMAVKATDEAGFEVLLTTDRRIRCQQNLATLRIALVLHTVAALEEA